MHRVDQAELTSDPGPVVERLRETAGRPNPPHLLTDIVFGTCIDLPESFRRPLPPLTDLVAEAGLARHGDWLAPGGFDFDQHFLDLQVNRLMSATSSPGTRRCHSSSCSGSANGSAR